LPGPDRRARAYRGGGALRLCGGLRALLGLPSSAGRRLYFERAARRLLWRAPPHRSRSDSAVGPGAGGPARSGHRRLCRALASGHPPDRGGGVKAASPLDYRDLARRRLPRFLFEYIDGGSYEEVTLAGNRAALREIALRQR